MTVYIDYPRDAHYKRFKDTCHMMSPDINELHEFAEEIGLKKEWFQDKHYPHYDLFDGKIQAALDNGAIQTSSVGMLMECS